VSEQEREALRAEAEARGISVNELARRRTLQIESGAAKADGEAQVREIAVIYDE
jgi:ABC-type uncharacterized transport system substrate-binding protein